MVEVGRGIFSSDNLSRVWLQLCSSVLERGWMDGVGGDCRAQR